jgi:hypothetical protein
MKGNSHVSKPIPKKINTTGGTVIRKPVGKKVAAGGKTVRPNKVR